MIESQPIRHRTIQQGDLVRLCDGQPAGEEDSPIGNIEALREAWAEATPCPICQVKSGYPSFHLIPPRTVHGNQTAAYLYTTPVQDASTPSATAPTAASAPESAPAGPGRTWQRA